MFHFIPRSPFISDKNDHSTPLLYSESLLLFLSNISWSTLLCLWLTGQRFSSAECIGVFIQHRSHGSFWASHRQAINELDASKFWRASIDNLNLNIKFAKNLLEGSTGAKKMLNLITGQVTHQGRSKSSTSSDKPGQRNVVPEAHT